MFRILLTCFLNKTSSHLFLCIGFTFLLERSVSIHICNNVYSTNVSSYAKNIKE